MATNGAPEQAVVDSFWDIDGFKRAVRRTEDGMQQCHELMKLMQERADIEKEYAKRIRMWAKKWADNIDKGPEYGTTKMALKGCMEAADRLAEAHIAVKDRILNAVQVRVKDWKNENYKKQIVGGCREAKCFEDDFRKAQKPWAKKLAKVTKAKKEYYNACRQERAVAAQENSLRSAVEPPPPENMRKAQERTEKCRKEMDATKQKYAAAILDLNAVNGKYMEDMVEVFERTQVFERRRLEFNKMILTELHNSLDLSQNALYTDVYRQIRETVEKTDVNKDLNWWSQSYGTGMSMTCPTFEECPGDTVPVDRSEKAAIESRMSGSVSNGASLGDAAVMSAATADSSRVYHNGAPVTVDPPQYAAVRANTTGRDPVAYRSSTTAVSDRTDYHQNAAAVSRPVSAAVTYSMSQREQPSHIMRSDSGASGDNPFNDSDEFTPVHYRETESTKYQNASEIADSSSTATFYEEIPLQTSAGGGVTVRALYDYNAVEDDELTFSAGDVFLKIKDVDAQGWCTGLKDGHVGLYPESYAQTC